MAGVTSRPAGRGLVSAEQSSRANMRDVARVAGVSQGTVSRVVNNLPVREPAKSRILATMRELNYLPNFLAQSMRTRTTMAVGCMVPDISIPFFAQAVGAAEQVLHAAGYTMIVTNSSDDFERELEILSLFQQRRLDGILIAISREDDPKMLSILQEMSMPMVIVQRTPHLPVDHVATDHYDALYEATRYLLSLGHRRISMITGAIRSLPGRERNHAIHSAYADAGLPIDESLLVFCGYDPKKAYRAAHEQLTSAQPPTAILAGASQMLGVLKAVRNLDIEVPRDLSLISIGDSNFAEVYNPPLTVVRWDIGHLGQSAAEILLTRLRGSALQEPLSMIVKGELVLRKSCAPPPAAGALALRIDGGSPA